MHSHDAGLPEEVHQALEAVGFFRQLKRAYDGRRWPGEELPLRATMQQVIKSYVDRATTLPGAATATRYIQQMRHDIEFEALTGSRAWRSGEYIVAAIEVHNRLHHYDAPVYGGGETGFRADVVARQLRALEDQHQDPGRDQDLVERIECDHAVDQMAEAVALLGEGHLLLPLVSELQGAASKRDQLRFGLLQEDAGLIAQGLEDMYLLPPGGGTRTYALRDVTIPRITVRVVMPREAETRPEAS
ncbi:hypothetical protein [Nonomuraea jabiensis]|uniref:hypothetical protein n=1 Tax=Nonomuraea jabiensis TaxID=882448 RepID=UPI003D721A87